MKLMKMVQTTTIETLLPVPDDTPVGSLFSSEEERLVLSEEARKEIESQSPGPNTKITKCSVDSAEVIEI